MLDRMLTPARLFGAAAVALVTATLIPTQAVEAQQTFKAPPTPGQSGAASVPSVGGSSNTVGNNKPRTFAAPPSPGGGSAMTLPPPPGGNPNTAKGMIAPPPPGQAAIKGDDRNRKNKWKNTDNLAVGHDKNAKAKAGAAARDVRGKGKKSGNVAVGDRAKLDKGKNAATLDGGTGNKKKDAATLDGGNRNKKKRDFVANPGGPGKGKKNKQDVGSTGVGNSSESANASPSEQPGSQITTSTSSALVGGNDSATPPSPGGGSASVPPSPGGGNESTPPLVPGGGIAFSPPPVPGGGIALTPPPSPGGGDGPAPQSPPGAGRAFTPPPPPGGNYGSNGYPLTPSWWNEEERGPWYATYGELGPDGRLPNGAIPANLCLGPYTCTPTENAQPGHAAPAGSIPTPPSPGGTPVPLGSRGPDGLPLAPAGWNTDTMGPWSAYLDDLVDYRLPNNRDKPPVWVCTTNGQCFKNPAVDFEPGDHTVNQPTPVSPVDFGNGPPRSAPPPPTPGGAAPADGGTFSPPPTPGSVPGIPVSWPGGPSLPTPPILPLTPSGPLPPPIVFGSPPPGQSGNIPPPAEGVPGWDCTSTVNPCVWVNQQPLPQRPPAVTPPTHVGPPATETPPGGVHEATPVGVIPNWSPRGGPPVCTPNNPAPGCVDPLDVPRSGLPPPGGGGTPTIPGFPPVAANPIGGGYAGGTPGGGPFGEGSGASGSGSGGSGTGDNSGATNSNPNPTASDGSDPGEPTSEDTGHGEFVPPPSPGGNPTVTGQSPPIPGPGADNTPRPTPSPPVCIDLDSGQVVPCR
jgi:hypothetical protein